MYLTRQFKLILMVCTGIEIFLREGLYKDKKIGLLSNPSGILVSGSPTWKALLNAGYDLKYIFGPEHGFLSQAQDAVEVKDHYFNTLKVISLFGQRLHPPREILDQLDLIIYDIQDVGSRYYTYIHTLANLMFEAARCQKLVVVLDRPNPIRNDIWQGVPIQPEFSSFVGNFGLPNRYGFTVGEFACYLKKYFIPDCPLEVVWMENYHPNLYFDQTGLPWTLPSPNLPTLDTCLVYPGTCLIEGTNLSEGRGTTRPFEIIGASWIKAEELQEKMFAYQLKGAVYSPVYFKPTISKFAQQACQGILISITDREIFDPIKTVITILHTINHMYPRDFKWRPLWEDSTRYFFDSLAGEKDLRIMIEKNAPIEDIWHKYPGQPDETFIRRRQQVLHY
ncbi:MAG: exo-beta-N-acetylmuramidase NamZ family protein [Candidatus Cyclobacteriaceae bacterium M3_2C_046]